MFSAIFVFAARWRGLSSRSQLLSDNNKEIAMSDITFIDLGKVSQETKGFNLGKRYEPVNGICMDSLGTQHPNTCQFDNANCTNNGAPAPLAEIDEE